MGRKGKFKAGKVEMEIFGQKTLVDTSVFNLKKD
jgi:hypothetical protein